MSISHYILDNGNAIYNHARREFCFDVDGDYDRGEFAYATRAAAERAMARMTAAMGAPGTRNTGLDLRPMEVVTREQLFMLRGLTDRNPDTASTPNQRQPRQRQPRQRQPRQRQPTRLGRMVSPLPAGHHPLIL